MEKLIPGEEEINRGKLKRSREKKLEDWIGASVWRVGRTAQNRVKYRRPVKAEKSSDG